MGPRVLPSQVGQPMEHPLLNQKQACPLAPESRPALDLGLRSSGIGHHGSNAGAPASETGTVELFHGARSWSIAFRGGGVTMEPWSWQKSNRMGMSRAAPNRLPSAKAGM